MLTLPTIVFIAISAGMLILAIGLFFAARSRCRLLKETAERFRKCFRSAELRLRVILGSENGGDPVRALQGVVGEKCVAPGPVPAPAYALIQLVYEEPEFLSSDEVVGSWIATAIDRFFGDLKSHLGFTRYAAPAFGLFGTVAGLMISALSYSLNRDQALLMSGFAVSYLTSLFGAVSLLFVRRALDNNVLPLERTLAVEMQEYVGRLRSLMGGPAARGSGAAGAAAEPTAMESEETGPAPAASDHAGAPDEDDDEPGAGGVAVAAPSPEGDR